MKLQRFCCLALVLLVSTTANASADKAKPKAKSKAKPVVTAAPVTAAPKAGQIIHIAYFSQLQNPPAALSNLDPFIADKGQLGAELAISDNNTTGQFIGQTYQLKKIIVPVDGDVAQAFNQEIAKQFDLVVVNLPKAALQTIAALPLAKDKLLFDTATSDDENRNAECQHSVLHILPSRAMRADALAQYLLKKRWQKWFLVVGQTAEDQLFAAAIKRAAKRFNSKIVSEKVWTNDFDSRRTAQADVPVFTQGEDYDVLVVADEQGLFGEYFDYRTWSPRPVVGTQGLIATAWHPTHELWGATQLQNRFKQQAGRWMQEIDYAAYMAVRAIGEASVRTKSSQYQILRDYLLSDKLALQGYKGMPLSFRAWDGQLRQPVLLAAPRALVSVAPVEGFLHPKTELDTLGFDQPESACR